MNLHNIHTIARYETKLLRRSWLFRIFAVIAIFVLSVFTLFWQTALNKWEFIWPRMALTSLMPFVSVLGYNIAQSIIVVFLAGSFLKRDKKLDTAEVIYVRPMSNADYIIGKTWGIVKVFLSLNVITLLITAFFNIAVNHSPFSPFPYLFYLVTISLPSLLFVLGLSFTVMCLLKNQAVTFIVMLGIIGTVFFELSTALYGVFDFFGMNIPAIFSDVTGHADLSLFLWQRTIYLLAGIGLICFTIALVNRLPHKPWKIVIVHTLGGIFLLVACITGSLYVWHQNRQMDLREMYVDSFNRYEKESKADILTHDLTVTPGNHRLEGESKILVSNPTHAQLERIVLYLNPGLEVESVQANQETVPFERDKQVLLINTPLNSGEELALTLNYGGHIDETVCYTDINDSTYLDLSVQNVPYSYGKRYAWLEDRFTLLTPECLWYPVAAAPTNPAAPYKIRKNFTRYTLTVRQPMYKTILSQGESREVNGNIVFTPEFPLPGISLTIGDYEKKSLQVDSVRYEIWYFKGHDYFSSHFTAIQDTLPGLIRNSKNDLEVSKGRDYPFRKFVMAEVPVQFESYIRSWKGYTEYTMPEIVFIPERGAKLNFDFVAEKNRMQGRRQNSMDETELTEILFRNFIRNVLLAENTDPFDERSKMNMTNITSLFFHHTGFVYSDEYPIMDIVLNSMQSTSQKTPGMWFRRIINDAQRANLYLENHSFRTALSDPNIKPKIFYELLKLKGCALQNYIRTQVPAKAFEQFLKTFFKQHCFSNIDFDSFLQEFKENFGIDLRPFISGWYTEEQSPTLLIQNVDANQVVIDEVTRYQIKFKIYNPSPVNGIITAEIQQGGDFRGGPHRGGGSFGISTQNNEPEIYIIPAGLAQEIKIIVDERPANVRINTNISHNLPSSYLFNFSKIENTVDDTTSGVSIIDPKAFKPNPNEIIIDNESRQFQTIASNNRHKLKDLFQKEEGEKYKNFSLWRMPSQWTLFAADYCYGESVCSGVYKKKGNGNNSVVWTAELPKSGYYEVSIWNAKQNMMFGMMGRGRGHREKMKRNQTYTIQYDKEKEDITLDLEQEEIGWVSIGNFYFSQGPVSITLTDKVDGDFGYVVADAVKFTLNNVSE